MSVPPWIFSAALASSRPRVCVVGCGAGGLVAARVLRSVAHHLVVYERELSLGGVWRPESAVLYSGLTTNLPRQIMGFRDVAFEGERSFVSAADVAHYLRKYAAHHKLEDCIRFGCEVKAVERVQEDGRSIWRVHAGETCEEYDAVVVANGHYNLPSYAHLPGADRFPNRVLHSSEYNVPEPFVDQTVLCIGARSSGTDIAREITQAGGKRTLTADRACRATEIAPDNDRLLRTPPIAELLPDGGVRFEDGHVEPRVDVIIHCVGYDYDFPFLKKSGDSSEDARIDATQVSPESQPLQFEVGGRRVAPLFEHLFHADDPSLSFLGIPHSVVPFPLMEVQATLVARVLTGDATLPDASERRAWVEKYEAGLKRPKDAHHLGNAQWDYCRRLLALAGIEDSAWQTAISVNEAVYNHVGPLRPQFPGGPDSYRELEYEVDHTMGRWRCVTDGSEGVIHATTADIKGAGCKIAGDLATVHPQ